MYRIIKVSDGTEIGVTDTMNLSGMEIVGALSLLIKNTQSVLLNNVLIIWSATMRLGGGLKQLLFLRLTAALF